MKTLIIIPLLVLSLGQAFGNTDLSCNAFLTYQSNSFGELSRLKHRLGTLGYNIVKEAKDAKVFIDAQSGCSKMVFFSAFPSFKACSEYKAKLTYFNIETGEREVIVKANAGHEIKREGKSSIRLPVIRRNMVSEKAVLNFSKKCSKTKTEKLAAK